MRWTDMIRRAGALAATGALALGLVACGGSTGGSSGSTSQVELPDASSTDVLQITEATTKDTPALTTDDLAPTPTLGEGTELTEEEAAQYADESRAFDTLPADSLLVNDADTFYYEEVLTGNTAVMYQILKTVAQDPENAGTPAGATSSIDPGSDEFEEMYVTALLALTYDHPELFWLYYSWAETSPLLGLPLERRRHLERVLRAAGTVRELRG